MDCGSVFSLSLSFRVFESADVCFFSLQPIRAVINVASISTSLGLQAFQFNCAIGFTTLDKFVFFIALPVIVEVSVVFVSTMIYLFKRLRKRERKSHSLVLICRDRLASSL
jgi:hypothetical protein